MAEQTELEVTRRTVMGKASKQLRRAGLIPANIYGHKEAPQALQVDAAAFERLKRSHGARNIVALRLPDASIETALIRHVQHSPSSGKIIHIDFTRVSMTERLESKIPLKFVGEAPGVKIAGGVLLHLVDSLAIECAASDIIESIDVDISGLSEIDSTLYVRDIKLPANYKLMADPEEPVVKIAAPRTEQAVDAEAAIAATPAAPAAE